MPNVVNLNSHTFCTASPVMRYTASGVMFITRLVTTACGEHASGARSRPGDQVGQQVAGAPGFKPAPALLHSKTPQHLVHNTLIRNVIVSC
jgi:hypothetical protein